MDPRLPILVFLLLGLGLILLGWRKRRQGLRHGAGEALDAESFARAGREQGNPFIVAGSALIAITLVVWLLGR